MSDRMAVIIAAHNEAAVIGETLASLRAATPPPDVIIVIADHCTDATASIAEQAGALVLDRGEGEAGKGPALRWLVTRYPGATAAMAGCVILDADSAVHPACFAELRRALAGGARAAQAFVQPVGFETSAVATLAAYSEILSQVMDDRLRTRLGWPVRLRGTGMAFRTAALGMVLPQVRTRTEDVELSLLLAERGWRTVAAPRAIVFDPLPRLPGGLARQRARWLQGQGQVWRAYGGRIVRLALGGPAVWSLLAALLIRPRALLFALKLLAGAVSFLVLPAPYAAALLALLIGPDLLYYGFGLFFVPSINRPLFARALLRAPLFLGVWLRSAFTAARARDTWLSARHD